MFRIDLKSVSLYGMEGQVVLLGIIVICSQSNAQFTDPYIADDVDGGNDVVVTPFTSQLGQPIVAYSHIAFALLEMNYCENYDFAINITEDLLKIQIKIYDGFSGSGGNPKCTVYWGDGANDTTNLIKSVEKENHAYEKFGIYSIHLVCSYKGITERCPHSISDCLQSADFLDDMYQSLDTPLTFFSNRPILIKSYMQIANMTCSFPSITWGVTKFENGTITDDIVIPQSGNSVLRLDAGTLVPGEYIVSLMVAFPTISVDHWSEDFLVVKIVHPELVTHISGGELLRVPSDQEIFIDARGSHDPVESISLDELEVTWSVAHYDITQTSAEGFSTQLDYFNKDFPDYALPPGSKARPIINGTEYVLKINTTSFPVSSTVIVIFSMTRSGRQSSAMQMLKIEDNTIPISLLCVYNCHIGRERMFYHDKIEVDITFPEGMVTVGFLYYWTVYVWDHTQTAFTSPLTPVDMQTDPDSQSLGIISYPEPGVTYKLAVSVSSPEGKTGIAELIRTANSLPYQGTCEMDSSSVVSARDWVTLHCSAWYGNDNRRTLDSSKDSNPILIYTVLQQTDGAAVYEEPILQTQSQRSHVILKVGNPDAGYNSILRVRVTDMFNDYTEIVLNIKSSPVFDVNSITPTSYGSTIITNYTTVDYAFDEKQLRDMGKDDMIISLVSAVCSNIHLIELPVWIPPAPRVLNSNGSVIDLNAAGNKDIGTLDEARANADVSADPATLALQNVIQNLTKIIEDVVGDTIAQGYRANDKMLSSLVTNAFTNLVSKEQFINTEAKISVIVVGQVVGIDALKETNSSIDESAQIETTAGEIYRMFQAAVNSVVPDDLTQNRHVNDLFSGGTQIDEMLTVLNMNISLYDTVMSPMERAYLYMKMQQSLRYNTDEKKNASQKAAQSAMILARDIQSKLKLCSKCNNRKSNSTQQLVHKNTGTNVTGDVIPTKSSSSQFRIDGLSKALANSSIDGAGTVDVSAFEFDENVYMYDDDGTSSFVTSKVLRVDVKSSDTQIHPEEMTFDQFVKTPEATRVTPEVDEDDASEFMYHNFIYQNAKDHVCLIVKPAANDSNATVVTNSTIDVNNITKYEVYFRFKESPSTLDYDFVITVYEDDDWVNCVTPTTMKGHTGITYIGISLPGDMKQVDYNLTIVSMGCLTWDEGLRKWHTDKCLLDWIPEYSRLSCYCHDVTDMVFANSFFVAPNSIDFSTVFLKFSPLDQAAVMGTLISIYVLFVICAILLARLDTRDKLKWGMTPLCDNIVSDNQFYIMKVYTGIRRGAGTKSSIAFNLKGTNGDTGPRSLSDGIRPGFSRGSCVTFFLATHKWLGPLQYLSLWHDTGDQEKFASWYLNQIVIYDVSKQQSYTFVGEQWLSVKTNVYINLLSHTKAEPISFESRFFYQTRDRLSEGHMWASIFYRPQISAFSRVQRLACALVYILLNMIANAIYFDPEPNYVAPPLLQVGPFRFTGQQIYVSIISALITTPPIMLLVFLFNRVQPQSETKPCCRCSCCCHSVSYKKQKCCRRTNSRVDGEFYAESSNSKLAYEEKLKLKLLTHRTPEFVGNMYLPHRCVYFIWVVVLASVVVPSFFILLYSIEWGKQKSEEWLTSFFLSLVESATVVDPVMVVGIALILATWKRSQIEGPNFDVVEIVRKYRKLVAGKIDREKLVSSPLEDDSLEAVQRKKKHQSNLTSSFRDLVLAFIFAMLVFSIAYSNRDDRSYLCNSEIVNTIVEPWKMPQFTLIKTAGDFYTWLNVSVIPNIFPDSYYNGDVLHWTERESMTGQNNLRLGPPRLRQLRSKKSKCKIPYIGTVECNNKYSILTEDEESFCLGWKQPPCSIDDKIFSESADAWLFTSALDIWGLPLNGHHTTYGGGGYIASFAVSRTNTDTILNELFNNTWINRQTRAVLFEFTLYNSGINMFIYNEFLVEFPETGGALTSFTVYPMRLYSHHGGLGTFTLICEILVFIFLVVFFVKICIRFYQQGLRYFKDFWQVYELVMFAIGVSAVTTFFIRLALTKLTISKFQEDKRLFVNFAHIVLWDQIYVTLLSTLVFMATLRLLQTFSASNKIKAIVTVFSDCGKDLFWFSTCFIYMLVGFCLFGLFLFGSHLQSYMSIYRSMTTLFLAIIGKSKLSEIEETQPVLAKIFFSFYILTIVFYVMTIFFAILGASIDAVTHNNRADQVEDLLDYMGQTVKRLFKKPKEKMGLKKRPSVHFTRIERIHITCSSAVSRSLTPTPRRGSMCLPSEPAIPVLRPHAFSRFKTTNVQSKITKGQSVFVGE